MAEQMKRYIRQQPEVWQSIVDSQQAILGELQQWQGSVKRLLIVGSGSSYNAALCVRAFLETSCGLETTVATSTGAFVAARLLPSKETLVLTVSQSGRSTNTLAAIDALKGKGFTVVSVTADEASPAAEKGDIHLLIACGEENVPPKTKGVTATILTLYLAGLIVAEKAGCATSQALENLVRAMEIVVWHAAQNIALSEAFCEVHMRDIATQPHFMLIADGAGYPSAAEGALKVLETLYVPTYAYEFEEYLHGVNNTIAPGCTNFMIPTHAENLERMLALESYAAARGCLNYVVSTLDIPQSASALKLYGSGSAYTAPFDVGLFFQVLSAMGSEAKGIDCDKPQFPDFYAAMNTKANA